ncbi:MAG: LPS export ABC transporter periplasmic protein LptC [Acidobacteria bacterium]|nr:MAG: LPS export ABC transporter periplasmic protein LptC [Acidobacteriota bacterium]
MPAPRTVRHIRLALLVLVLVVGVSVTFTFFRSRSAVTPTPAPSAPPEGPTSARAERFEYKSFKGDKEGWFLRALNMVGQEQEDVRLRGVDLTFTYMAKGQPGKGRIVSDEALINPSQQKGNFQGHVIVTTEEGFELHTESLVYRGDKQLAKTEAPVEFKRKDVSGTSTGMTYDAGAGRLELLADVTLRIQDEGNPATDIKAAHALLVRPEGTMRFDGAVRLTQAGDVLTADRFEVDFGSDQTIYRARAIENVVLDSTSGNVPGTAPVPGGQGPRHLTCRKLDLWLRPDRSLEQAVAAPDADLTMRPGPKDPPEKRRLQARALTFRFDEQGHLYELEGQKDSSFDTAPIPPAKGVPRRLRCQSFLARVYPATGDIKDIEFRREVVFEQAPQKATAENASYDGASGVLTLRQGPEMVDDEQGSRLRAGAIDMNTRTNDFIARRDVHHVLRRKGGGQGLLMGGAEPALVTSTLMEYTDSTHTARYQQSALLRSGKDEIRAPEIRLQQIGPEGKWRLEASGGVVSFLHPNRDSAKAPQAKDAPKGAAEKARETSTVEGRAKEMTYMEEGQKAVYRGDVSIRQGDIATRSPEATLNFTSDGSSIQTLVAGEPVEVKQGDRHASGARGTYTPQTETMILVGPKVTLKDPTQQVEGRSLTFHVGDDRVLVDGQEQVRTLSIIRNRKEPPKP